MDVQASESKIKGYLSRVLKSEHPVAVLLSGGVDSSVALASLLRYGCRQVTAYYLKIWFEEDAQILGECPWEEDLEYASAVCQQLNVPLRVVSMQREYYDYVVSYTLAELRSGRTPSPDVLCNQYVKFGAFLQHLKEAKSLIATGHYALLEYRSFGEQEQLIMRQAPDPVKDQSYFLARLAPEQLQNLVFPLGCLRKKEVRLLAEYWDLPTAKRKDSQGICFLGKLKFRNFAQHYLGENPGPIVDYSKQELENAVLGEHRGLWFHTIGQRQGLGLGNGPWYVCAKDMEKNILYVCHAQGHLLQNFIVGEGLWLLEKPPFEGLKAEFPEGQLCLKLRHGPAKLACEIREVIDEAVIDKVSNIEQEKTWHVSIEVGDRGIAPGQFAVFYWGDICLGSASIQSI